MLCKADRTTALALALGLATFSPALLHAQAAAGPGGVRGTVTTTDDEPVPAATIDVVPPNDSAPVGSAVTAADGRFLVDSIPAGVYALAIEHLGYGNARTVEFTVVAGQVRDLGTIRLDVEALALEPIVVAVDRPDIRFEPDRTGYLVDAIAGAYSGVITDALRGIPELDVDIDGEVRLRDEHPAIYIDGRPAPMSGVSLSVFLEQFPADQIERIEVIENPSARFGAAGSGGVINIVLKEGVELGLTGAVSLTAGTRGERSAGGRATLQRGPWTFTGGLNSRWSHVESSSFTLRQNLLADPTTFLEKGGRSDQSTRAVGAMADVRYELSEGTRLHLRLSADTHGGDQHGLTETIHLDEGLDPTLRYDRLSNRDGDGDARTIAVGVSRTWEPRRHALELEARARWSDDGSGVRDAIEADPVYQGAEELPPWLTQRDDAENDDALGLDLDYVRPLGEHSRIEVGGALDRDETYEEQATRRFEAVGVETPDSVDAWVTAHVRTLSSLYLTLQRQIGKLGVQAGVRSEFVRDAFDLPADVGFERSEGSVFPSLNLSWSPGDDIRIRGGYSQRIRRPDLGVLDPTDCSTDPLNRRVGNPDIGSATTHSLSATLTWTRPWGMLSIGPRWNRTNDDWERVTTADEEGVSTTIWDNLGSRTYVGTSMTVSARQVAGFGGFVNLSGGRSTVAGSVVADDFRDGEFFWSARASLFGRVAGPVTAQGSLGYQPGRNLAQGRTSGLWTADISLRLRLLENRASFGLTFRDPFGLRDSSQEIRDPSVLQTERTRISSRSVSAALSYGFGGGGDRPGGGPPGRR
jgi:outer membrane receptor protein involved in Fe transport